MEPSDKWRAADRRAEQPKTDPWLLFGTALIVTVGAVLFAVAVWMIRGGQATDAIARADEMQFELDHEKEEHTSLSEENERLATVVDDLRKDNEQTAAELYRTKAELASITRELEGTNEALETASRNELNPRGLEHASLREILGDDFSFSASVFVQDDAGSANLSRGALTEHVKQRLRDEYGVRFDDTSDTRLIVSVSAVTTTGANSNYTALSVLMVLQQGWKVPGAPKRENVSIWSHHSVGLTNPDRAAAFLEELVNDLIEMLGEELSK